MTKIINLRTDNVTSMFSTIVFYDKKQNYTRFYANIIRHLEVSDYDVLVQFSPNVSVGEPLHNVCTQRRFHRTKIFCNMYFVFSYVENTPNIKITITVSHMYLRWESSYTMFAHIRRFHRIRIFCNVLFLCMSILLVFSKHKNNSYCFLCVFKTRYLI